MTSGSIASTEDLSGHEGNVRKRVGKACDRCRLKKSKCDGSKPCSRCKADNQLCLFGERKKAHDKVYPKGYVELLEHQQMLLVHALQSVYRQYWTGPSLPEVDGNPLVHDMLESLGLLQDDGCSSPLSFDGFHFEEDPAKMQSRLSESEAGSKHGTALDSPPAMSPGSLTSQSTLFPDSLLPSTPQDLLGFPPHLATPHPSLAPFTRTPTQMQPSAAQMLQFSQGVDTAKSMDLTFPSALSPKLTGDAESLGPFSAQYPYTPAFNDYGADFMEEDSFGNFVDLGAS